MKCYSELEFMGETNEDSEGPMAHVELGLFRTTLEWKLQKNEMKTVQKLNVIYYSLSAHARLYA
jgi:hypothetical protein